MATIKDTLEALTDRLSAPNLIGSLADKLRDHLTRATAIAAKLQANDDAIARKALANKEEEEEKEPAHAIPPAPPSPSNPGPKGKALQSSPTTPKASRKSPRGRRPKPKPTP